MKKLLYVAAIAVLSTSCSVDEIQNDSNNNTFEQISLVKDDYSLLCNTLKLLNNKEVERGQVQSFVDNKNQTVTLRILSPDWKIDEYKIFYGSEADMGTGEDLFSYGLYEFNEGYINNTYFMEFQFSMEDIKSSFVFNAKLSVQKDGRYENVWATNNAFSVEDNYIIENYLTNCIK